MSHPDVTQQLATFTSGLSLNTIPEDVAERARMVLLDHIGIILGAVDFERTKGDNCLDRYIEMAAPPGSATVIGQSIKTAPMMAAFINGTRAEVLDCQDTNLECNIHNGPGVAAAALAAAEENDSDGARLVAGIVAGIEVGCRIAKATQLAHWHSGFQITGTYNTCAAAAAAGHVMQLSTEQLKQALGISGFIIPISNGDNVFKGHSIKPIHGGQPAMSGLSAAYLSAAGYEAGPLEGEPPRYHSPMHILGNPEPDLEASVKEFDSLWYSRGVAFKPYPVGHFNVGPCEACIELHAEKSFTASDIASVRVATYHSAWKFTGGKYTTPDSNYVDAHLSMPYCMAATLMDGKMTPAQLSTERLKDPAVHGLAARIKVEESKEYSKRFPDEWPLHIEITLKDGRIVQRTLENVKWSPRRPPSWAEISAKFRQMSEPVIGETRAEKVIQTVANIERLASIRPLLSLVTSS